MRIEIDTSQSHAQRKQRERKQFVENLISVGFMLLILTGIGIVGIEFTNTKLEATSWIKIVAGCCVFWFSIYGIKIILRIK